MRDPIRRLADILANFTRAEFRLHYCRRPFSETSINIDHDRKLIFIHNPKTAGTSISGAIGMTQAAADHRTPTELVHHKTWESYFSFVVVRNPFDRLVSSYAYHTDREYTGVYFGIYPHLHDLSFEDYFDLMVREPRVIRPQVDYLRHKFSAKTVDVVCRFEHIDNDIEPVFQQLRLASKLMPVKRSSHEHYRHYYSDESLRLKVQSFYQADLDEFGYAF